MAGKAEVGDVVQIKEARSYPTQWNRYACLKAAVVAVEARKHGYHSRRTTRYYTLRLEDEVEVKVLAFAFERVVT